MITSPQVLTSERAQLRQIGTNLFKDRKKGRRKKCYNLTKTWFNADPDESAMELQGKTNIEQGVVEVGKPVSPPLLPSTLPPVNVSTYFEGEKTHLPTGSQDYEEDQIPASTGSERDGLVMPEMINLEALGMCRSPCLTTQERTCVRICPRPWGVLKLKMVPVCFWAPDVRSS